MYRIQSPIGDPFCLANVKEVEHQIQTELKKVNAINIREKEQL